MKLFVIEARTEKNERVFYPANGVTPTSDPIEAMTWRHEKNAERRLAQLTGWGTLKPVICPIDSLWLDCEQHRRDCAASNSGAAT